VHDNVVYKRQRRSVTKRDRRVSDSLLLEVQQTVMMPETARFAARFVPALVAVFACAGLSPSQTRQILAWQEDLTHLQNASGDQLTQGQAAVVQIRNGVELWLKMHPGASVELLPAPQQPWGVEEIRGQVSELLQAAESILKEDPGRPFDLGMTTVSVTAEASPLSPLADTIDQKEIVNRRAVNVAAALDYLPGVAIDHVSSGRNEADIRIRGFSSRGQVPLYLDGIPVSMPYDATIDFNRFLTSDIAEVQVAKGYSSPLLGPNALGGSINLVTRQPEKKLDADALLGTGSGNTLLASMHLGSRWRDFYAQGSVDWLQRDFIPISGNFPLNDFQPTHDREQSDSRDQKYSGRFAWTPKGRDEYVFTYTNQKGEKGVPLYAGPNSAATFSSTAYRRWPSWNNTNYYFLTDTALGEASSIRFRGYYYGFFNEFDFYDDATYTTMKKPSSNHSLYNDPSYGASTEFTSRSFRRHLISSSLFFKDETHREYNIYPGRSPFPLTTGTLRDRSQLFSIGVQDVITISARLRASLGFSADHLKGLQAQAFNSTLTGVQPVTCVASPDNTSFSGCTAHVWNYNPQASISYTLTRNDAFFVTFADRGRFPILKESYSYRLGSGIPNPDLLPEQSTNWDIGYSRAFGARIVAQLDYFHQRLRNAIESVYVQDPGGFCNNTGSLTGYCSQNLNIGKEVHQGFEANLRSTPVACLTLDVNYSYINRTLEYDFSGNTDVSQVNTAIQVLPTLARNKLLANATLQLPHGVLALAGVRYEGGITLQDTTYRSAPGNVPYGAAYGTMDLGAVIPVRASFSFQAGVMNVFDRDYYYTAGYPEAGRNWYLNLRYRF
jgi:iron complex outermembrane recepter protein